jgi:hypothetical protein
MGARSWPLVSALEPQPVRHTVGVRVGVLIAGAVAGSVTGEPPRAGADAGSGVGSGERARASQDPQIRTAGIGSEKGAHGRAEASEGHHERKQQRARHTTGIGEAGSGFECVPLLPTLSLTPRRLAIVLLRRNRKSVRAMWTCPVFDDT